MAEKNGFDITKSMFQNMVCVWHCGAKEVLAPADEPGSTPGDAIFCFFVSFFFFLFSLCFLVLFCLLGCFSLFVPLTLLIMHLDQYIF